MCKKCHNEKLLNLSNVIADLQGEKAYLKELAQRAVQEGAEALEALAIEKKERGRAYETIGRQMKEKEAFAKAALKAEREAAELRYELDKLYEAFQKLAHEKDDLVLKMQGGVRAND